MSLINLSIINCKIVEHHFGGEDDNRGIGIQFIEQTKLFDSDGKEVNIEDYFGDAKDLWVWVNKTKESDGPFWKAYFPTTRVFYVLDGEKFRDRHEVSLEDADAWLDPEKEYVGYIGLKLRERRFPRTNSDKYVPYATRIAIKEL